MFFIHPSPTCPSISTILQITHIQLLNLTRSLADLFNPSALLPNSPFLSAALRSEMASPRIYLLWVNSNHHHQQTGVVDCRCTLCNPKVNQLIKRYQGQVLMINANGWPSLTLIFARPPLRQTFPELGQEQHWSSTWFSLSHEPKPWSWWYLLDAFDPSVKKRQVLVLYLWAGVALSRTTCVEWLSSLIKLELHITSFQNDVYLTLMCLKHLIGRLS